MTENIKELFLQVKIFKENLSDELIDFSLFMKNYGCSTFIHKQNIQM